MTAIVAPTSAWAIGGGLGCSDLPEYDRAQGTLQGLSTCDMTVDQARRIVAAQSGGGVYQQAAPRPHAHRRHHQVRRSQP